MTLSGVETRWRFYFAPVERSSCAWNVSASAVPPQSISDLL
jgi:hypothetical protein